MNKTYSELRQEAYFRAARDLIKIATMVLDDVTNDAEFTGRTHDWAQSVSRSTMKQAYALENLGHEQAIASPRQESLLRKAKLAHSDAVTRIMQRYAAAVARQQD